MLRIASLSLRKQLDRVTAERDRYYRWATGHVDFSENGIKSNVENWKILQDDGYFEHHPNHKGLVAFSSDETKVISQFHHLRKSDTVVVVGCGYGRDVAQIAPHVGHIYGIDVNQTILAKATSFLASQGITNFTPVVVDDYETAVPDEIDLAFCFVVTQHLTRDLTRQYVEKLGRKLSRKGILLFQFLETMVEGETLLDARLENYEPSVSWTVTQLHRLGFLCGLKTVEIKTIPVSNGAALWHWAAWSRKDAQDVASAGDLT